MSGFTDSCYGFSKLLYVQYKCVSPTALTTSTTSTSPTTTTTLPYCSNYITPSGTCSSIATSPFVPTFVTANQTSFGYPVMQQVVCLGSSVNLVCPANTVIHIYSAYFGIQSTTFVSTCFITSGEQPAMCYYTSSFSYINSTCKKLKDYFCFYLISRKLPLNRIISDASILFEINSLNFRGFFL